MFWGLLSVAEKDLCKLIYAFFKLILIAVVADSKPFFYRCACHGVADDVFQDHGIVPFPEKFFFWPSITFLDGGVPFQEPVNPFPDIAVWRFCAVAFQSLPDQFPFPFVPDAFFLILYRRAFSGRFL